MPFIGSLEMMDAPMNRKVTFHRKWWAFWIPKTIEVIIDDPDVEFCILSGYYPLSYDVTPLPEDR